MLRALAVTVMSVSVPALAATPAAQSTQTGRRRANRAGR
jgi:hypothetical protein